MSMKSYIKVFALLFCLSLSACSWLDIEPEGEATDKKLYSTGDGFRTVLAGVYSQMANKTLYGVDLQFGYVDCLSQQYDWSWRRGGFGGRNNTSVYQRVASFEYKNDDVLKMTDAIWETGYNAIANANKLIQEVEATSPSLFEYKEMERSMILGEAYACRALVHFDLCRLFAPAPVENDNSVNLPYVDKYPAIQPEGIDIKMYLDKVVADFEKAAELTLAYDTTALGMGMNASWRARFENEKEYGFEDKLPSGEVPESFLKNRGYRITHHAVKALLARVYLYRGEYDKALEMAQAVWDAKAKGLKVENVRDMYKDDETYQIGHTNDPEKKQNLRMPWTIIFALNNDNAYNDYHIESYFKKVADRNSPGEWFFLALKGQEIFTNKSNNTDEYQQDFRGQHLTFTPNYDGLYGREPLYVYSLKLFPSANELVRNKTLDKTPIIRTTEMQYIIAECHARKGDYAKAYEYLNTIRQNRGLWGATLPVATDLDTFIRDFVNDAQREWISEGQLFYLYKRLQYPCVGNNPGERRPMNKSEYMPPIPVNQKF